MGEKAGGGLVSPFQQGLDAGLAIPRCKAALARERITAADNDMRVEGSGQDGISRLERVPSSPLTRSLGSPGLSTQRSSRN